MTKPRILIADDDRDMLQLLRRQLIDAGYDVVCAQDSYQALEQARRCQPDLMLLDVNMPAGDGFSVQDRVRRQIELADVPVIYLTGDRSPRVAMGARKHGATIIQKPFELFQLLADIQQALEPSSMAS